MRKLGVEGTIVIEKEIRDRLRLERGIQIVQEVVGEQVVLTFVRPSAPRSAFGILAEAARRLDPDLRALLATPYGGDAAADEAWGEYVRERYAEAASS